MCGRFSLGLPARLLAALFGLNEPEEWEPRYNLAPSQPLLSVRADEQGRRTWFRPVWGLVPRWAYGQAAMKPLINARLETVMEKPSFREAFRKRRCLIPADGFFEWQGRGRKKTPFWFHRVDGQAFALAGLWEPGLQSEMTTCTIVTTRANAVVAPVHERMPVMLIPASFDLWLQGKEAEVQSLLEPFQDQDLVTVRVSARVNSPKSDDELCVQPVQELLDCVS